MFYLIFRFFSDLGKPNHHQNWLKRSWNCSRRRDFWIIFHAGFESGIRIEDFNIENGKLFFESQTLKTMDALKIIPSPWLFLCSDFNFHPIQAFLRQIFNRFGISIYRDKMVHVKNLQNLFTWIKLSKQKLGRTILCKEIVSFIIIFDDTLNKATAASCEWGLKYLIHHEVIPQGLDLFDLLCCKDHTWTEMTSDTMNKCPMNKLVKTKSVYINNHRKHLNKNPLSSKTSTDINSESLVDCFFSVKTVDFEKYQSNVTK